MPAAPVEVRLAKHINKTETCWLWTGYIDKHGYGRCTYNKKVMQAHRMVYEYLVGPIPDGLPLDHTCMIKCCVNPEHLEPVTSGENTRRWAMQITKCPAGHAYDEENTRWTKEGTRKCRACDRERYHRRKSSERFPGPPGPHSPRVVRPKRPS